MSQRECQTPKARGPFWRGRCPRAAPAGTKGAGALQFVYPINVDSGQLGKTVRETTIVSHGLLP